MKYSIKNILPVLVVFLLVNLACNFPTGDALPINPATPEPVIALEGEGESSVDQDPSTGRITVVLTEADLTTYLAAEMAAQDNPPLRDPRVLLRDGLIEVLGRAQSGPFNTDVRLVMVVLIDDSGSPQFEVLSADLGPVPAPDSVRSQLTSAANDTFRAYLRQQLEGYRVEQVVINDGRITITGVPR